MAAKAGPGEATLHDRRTAVQGAARRAAVRHLACGLLALLVFAVASLLNGNLSAAPAAAPGSAPQTPGPLAVIPGAPLTARPLVAPNGDGYLVQPQEAVRGPAGDIYVADPGAHGVLVYDRRGTYLRALATIGDLQKATPFSLAAGTHGRLYVLDTQAESTTGRILEYASPNAAPTILASSRALAHARDLTVGPVGHLYVTSPRENGVLEFSPRGRLLAIHRPARGTSPGTFNQPTSTAVAPDGTIIVVDTGNARLVSFAAGRPRSQWPAPAGGMLRAARVLPLAHHHLLVADPSGLLLDYDLRAHPVRIHSHPLQRVHDASLLAVTPLDPRHVLVTDTGNRAVWRVTLRGDLSAMPAPPERYRPRG
jgi:hypothetical protein